MNLFQELELLFQSLASILSVNMQQRLVVQVLPQTSHSLFTLQGRWKYVQSFSEPHGPIGWH